MGRNEDSWSTHTTARIKTREIYPVIKRLKDKKVIWCVNFSLIKGHNSKTLKVTSPKLCLVV